MLCRLFALEWTELGKSIFLRTVIIDGKFLEFRVNTDYFLSSKCPWVDNWSGSNNRSLSEGP